MAQTGKIRKLNNRLKRIESEITAIRQELSNLTGPKSENLLPFIVESSNFVNKRLLEEEIQELFSELSIQGEAVGSETFQERMLEAGLGQNELSQSIIAARDE